ncbi:MAG: hypothetical protein U1D35_18355 [Paracoccaceae bacterium]|nr:hypothetical protein [Paracoccaceae bacterium]
MHLQTLPPQTEFDTAIARAKPRSIHLPALPWGEAMLGLALLALLKIAA